MHRQTDDCFRLCFAYAQIAAADREARIAGLLMKRYWIVCGGWYAAVLHMGLEAVAFRHFDRILRPYGVVSLQDGRSRKDNIIQRRAISLGDFLTSLDFVREKYKLLSKDRSLN